MNSKRFTLALALVAATAFAIPAVAGAVKIPTFYYYAGKCNKAKVCAQTAYTNSTGKQLISFQLAPKCSNAKSTFSIALLNPEKIKNGKFKFDLQITNADGTDTQSVDGKASITGKLSKKNKISGSYKVDNISPGCANVKTGKFSMKYKGAVHGG